MSSVSRPPRRINIPPYAPPLPGPAPTEPAPAPAPEPASEPKARKPREPKPAHGTARLTLTIGQTDYTIKPFAADPGADVSILIRLRKVDGTMYFVAQEPWGASCDCPSYQWDHVDTDGACKHIAALRAFNLLPPAESWGSYRDDCTAWEPSDHTPAEDPSL